MSYRAPAWLRLGVAAGHAQTILPALVGRAPHVAYVRERWDTPDGDFVDLDWHAPHADDAALVVVFHGLEGSSRSAYARGLVHAAAVRGWNAVVVHFRGCSGEANRLPRAYHSGDSDELDWILRRLHASRPTRTLHACGISLGGNALAKWLGERGPSACFVRRACVICAPLDLAAGGHALSRGFNLLYTRMFLRTLKRKTREKVTRHPELAHLRARLREIARARDLHAYDGLYTAPVHGFRDTDDYWSRASAKPWLARIAVPTLVLNARNDPFVPASSLPTAADVSAHVTLEQPEEGGHVGFATGRFPGRLDWLPRRIVAFLDGDPRHG